MKKPASIAISIMAGKANGEEGDSYKEPATEAADTEEDTAEGEGTDYGCPECGTTCCATMPKAKMSCPCCGADMQKMS